MKLILAVALFIICILYRRSKFALALVMIGLWVFMTFCGETLDSQNYINEFSNISLSNAVKEPLYVLFVYFFNSLGISYELYHAISSAIVILIIGCTTYKFAINYNLALGLFLVYPFALYAVQIRNFYAFSICMIALTFLNKNTESSNGRSWFKKNKNELLYVIFVIFASLIHSAYIIFLIFLLAEKFDMKKVIITTVIALIVEAAVLNPTIILRIAEIFNVRARLEHQIYFNSLNGQSDIPLRIIITFIMYFFCFWYLQYRIKRRYDASDLLDIQVYRQNALALKINTLCLVIIPVVPLIREVFRIQEALMLLNYITITNNMDQQSTWKKDTIRNALIIVFLLFFIFVDDFLYILRFDGMREFVLKAVFG